MKFGKLFPLALCYSVLSASVVVRAQEAEPEFEVATNSQIVDVQLPGLVFRLKQSSVPQEMKEGLGAIAGAMGPNFKQGRSEVLAWSGPTYKKANVPQIKAQMVKVLKADGWEYQEGEKVEQGGQEAIMMTVVRAKPKPRAVMGFWAPADAALILGWTEILEKNSPAVENVPAPTTSAPTATAPANPLAKAPTAPATNVAGATTFDVAANARYVNVMKGVNPKIPTFTDVKPKPGFVRGYVKDWNGKPLANAKLGVRSTAVGGAYSGSSGKTDANGYYEFAVPFGAAHFYAAGYTVDWEDGRAALSLHPADGELDGFASNVGGVENFVLLPYGISNRDKASESPEQSGYYYGGSITVSYSVSDGGIFASERELPANSKVEITLTPDGPLLDGSAGRTFVIRKQIEFGGYFYVNNIPLGRYRISATLNGAPLNLKETGPYSSQPFGLEPKTARGSAILTFRPGGAQAEITTAAYGNWRGVNVTLER